MNWKIPDIRDISISGVDLINLGFEAKEIGKIKQRLKLKVGEFLNKKTDREPIILPIIMEV